MRPPAPPLDGASARRGLRASSTQGHLVFEAQEKLPPWRCSAEAAPTPAPRPPPTPWQPHAPRRPPAPWWPRLPAVPSTTAQPLVHLRGCSVQCFTFSYSPGGCGSWGSSLASVLQGAVAGEGRRHRGPSDLGRGYTTIHALSFEAEEKKREKKEIHALLVRAPLLLTCFLKESNIYAPAPSAALLLRLRL